MSDEVSIVKEVFDAVETGDTAGVLRHLAPDVHWEPKAFVTGQGDFHGHSGVREWLGQIRKLSIDGTEMVTFANDFRRLDDGRILVLGAGRLRREVGTLEQELGWLWTLRDGQVTEMRNYLSHDEALREAGLESESGH